eukprot:CAMPEP_0115640126 /NCGR_PEP_ID=MMETSP0272-20121206/35624_1 /TAXON_ID=71861 /ORGANISM="Scrippsiella trochoidea, Strain CCMP3099" /LENGTH=31 /DNA_ID= /DNA_START= /DNA_END= /DNA_ORIENTATION=
MQTLAIKALSAHLGHEEQPGSSAQLLRPEQT